MENIKEFLEELTALTLRYKIGIGGCGCCGSPCLFDTTKRNCFDIANDDHIGRNHYVIDESLDNLKWV